MCVLAASVLILAGCGGAAVDTSATDAAPADPAAAPVDPNAQPQPGATADPNAPTDGALVANPSDAASGSDDAGIAESSAAPGTQVATSDSTPKAFVKALGRKPIVVVIYQPGAVVDDHLIDEARQAANSVDGVVFLSYVAGDFKHYGDLPGKIGLLSSPSVAVISRDGSIENFWAGYVDHILIGKAVALAAAAKPASVSPSDAPPVQANPLDAAATGAAAPNGAAPPVSTTTS